MYTSSQEKLFFLVLGNHMPIFLEVRRLSLTDGFPLSLPVDIIECMANSDNVIRAGLTPKLRDIPNLPAGPPFSFRFETPPGRQPPPVPPPPSLIWPLTKWPLFYNP